MLHGPGFIETPPLLTTGNDAFVNEGDSLVGHGGIAIEEVILPLIKVEMS